MPTALATCAMQRVEIAITCVGALCASQHGMFRALGFASLVVVSGCIDDRDVQLPEEPVQVKAETFELPQASPLPLDILIVVDNSSAMADVEANVVANLPAFGAFFEKNSGWWDRHIGVVTADIGCADRAPWRHDGLTNERFFIDWRHLDGTRTKNFDGTLADHLPAAMAAGHDGCGAHRPLDAIVAALDPATRFRRTDADLIIVIIGASDDRSVIGIDDAIANIRARVDSPDSFGPRIATAVIAPEHAARLRTFAHDIDDREVDRFAAITTDDLLSGFGWGFHTADSWGVHCFQSEFLDVDAAAAGMQASCTVSDVVRDRDSRTTIYEKALPGCTGSNRPCWRVEVRPVECGYEVGYGIEIDRIDFPPPGTAAVGQCEIFETP